MSGTDLGHAATRLKASAFGSFILRQVSTSRRMRLRDVRYELSIWCYARCVVLARRTVLYAAMQTYRTEPGIYPISHTKSRIPYASICTDAAYAVLKTGV
eukprot:329432-Rhodomonas_salina.1